MKVLHLDYTDADFFAQRKRDCGVDVSGYFDDYAGTVRRLRRLPLLMMEPFFSRMLSKQWATSHQNYDLIIVPASFIASRIVRFIRRSNQHSRIVVWYWNSVANDTPVGRFKGLDCELWSFDERDCRVYGLKHNSQYYFELPNPDVPRNLDAIFLGIDKGRVSVIKDIEGHLTSHGFSCQFHVVADVRSRPDAYPFARNPIQYGDYLTLIHRSSVIVDVMAQGQDGLTLRPLEALFHSRKLITNNRRIKDYDFYRPENIFIWGVDDLTKLVDFMRAPYNSEVFRLSRHYAFGSWVERLGAAT